MGTVTLFTAARMQEIEDTTVVSGLVDIDGNLILTTREGVPINAGLVRGVDGVDGVVGAVGPAGPPGLDGTDSFSTVFQLGAIFAWAGDIIPIGHLELNGQTIVGGATTYSGLSALFPSWVSGANLILPNWGEQVPVGKKTKVSLGTFTVTIATPGLITNNSHGLADGQRVEFTTTGALPTGLVAGVRYFVRDSALNTFRVATTLGGTAINTSGSQSGVHTLWDSDFTVIGESVGAKTHRLSVSELASHTHAQATKNAGTVTANEVGKGDSSSGTAATGNGIAAAGGDRPHNNVQPSRVVKWIVCAATSSGEFDTAVQTALLSRVTSLENIRVLGQIPSSVQLGSGSSSVDDDGTVVFTGASRVSLNGIFDGLGSDIYEFEGYCVGSAVGAIYTRMRQNGVDRSTAVYNFVGNYTVNAAGPTRLSNFGQVYFGLWWINYTANVPSVYIRGTFFRPAQNTQTQLLLHSGTSASDRLLWHEYGDASTAVEDGLSIIATAGTMTGKFKVRKVA